MANAVSLLIAGKRDMAADESSGLAAARVFFAQNEKPKELQVCVPKE